MEWTPHRSSWASSDTVRCTFSYHPWQFITIFTITACIFSYSLSVSFWTQDLALQQIFFSIDLFLFYRGLITQTLGPSNDFTLLNGWICQCVRLSRLLVGFRMHFKSLHFHSFIHSFVLDMTYNVFGETLSLNQSIYTVSRLLIDRALWWLVTTDDHSHVRQAYRACISCHFFSTVVNGAYPSSDHCLMSSNHCLYALALRSVMHSHCKLSRTSTHTTCPKYCKVSNAILVKILFSFCVQLIQ